MKRNLFTMVLGFWLLVNVLHAQSSEALLDRLLQDDKASIEALVLYPEATRNDILQASLYPELVVRIGEMQRLTSRQFSDLLAPLPEADQKSLWELARFPALVAEIAARGGLKEEALKDFPLDIHDEARWADGAQRPVVVKMHELYVASEAAFASLLRTYPDPAQRAFRNLVGLPEVMGILGESLKMTILVGDMYRHDPAWVIHKLDSLNLEVARRNAEDLQAWRDSLSANPQALQEFQESSEEFRQAQGAPVATEQEVNRYTTYNTYNTYNYTGGNNQGYANYGYYYNPYPWWYGYPTWYDYPYWYPQPYWYHSGYYYGQGGVIIVYGMPSAYYTWWYFHHPWHHSHYPHLTHHMLCYHEGHRDAPGGFNHEVNHWVNENQNVFGKDWLKNDGHRPDRIKEYGQFEVSYHNSQAKQPLKTPTEQAYFETHAKDYPNLNAAVNASPRPMAPKPDVARPVDTWPVTKPTIQPSPKPNSQTEPKPVVKPNTNPKPVPNTETAPQPPKIERPPQNEIPRSNPAPSYHKDTWQRADPSPVYTPKPTFTPRLDNSPRPTFTPKPTYSPKPNTSPKGR